MNYTQGDASLARAQPLAIPSPETEAEATAGASSSHHGDRVVLLERRRAARYLAEVHAVRDAAAREDAEAELLSATRVEQLQEQLLGIEAEVHQILADVKTRPVQRLHFDNCRSRRLGAIEQYAIFVSSAIHDRVSIDDCRAAALSGRAQYGLDRMADEAEAELRRCESLWAGSRHAEAQKLEQGLAQFKRDAESHSREEEEEWAESLLLQRATVRANALQLFSSACESSDTLWPPQVDDALRAVADDLVSRHITMRLRAVESVLSVFSQTDTPTSAVTAAHETLATTTTGNPALTQALQRLRDDLQEYKTADASDIESGVSAAKALLARAEEKLQRGAIGVQLDLHGTLGSLDGDTSISTAGKQLLTQLDLAASAPSSNNGAVASILTRELVPELREIATLCLAPPLTHCSSGGVQALSRRVSHVLKKAAVAAAAANLSATAMQTTSSDVGNSSSDPPLLSDHSTDRPLLDNSSLLLDCTASNGEFRDTVLALLDALNTAERACSTMALNAPMHVLKLLACASAVQSILRTRGLHDMADSVQEVELSIHEGLRSFVENLQTASVSVSRDVLLAVQTALAPSPGVNTSTRGTTLATTAQTASAGADAGAPSTQPQNSAESSSSPPPSATLNNSSIAFQSSDVRLSSGTGTAGTMNATANSSTADATCCTSVEGVNTEAASNTAEVPTPSTTTTRYPSFRSKKQPWTSPAGRLQHRTPSPAVALARTGSAAHQTHALRKREAEVSCNNSDGSATESSSMRDGSGRTRSTAAPVAKKFERPLRFEMNHAQLSATARAFPHTLISSARRQLFTSLSSPFMSTGITSALRSIAAACVIQEESNKSVDLELASVCTPAMQKVADAHAARLEQHNSALQSAVSQIGASTDMLLDVVTSAADVLSSYSINAVELEKATVTAWSATTAGKEAAIAQLERELDAVLKTARHSSSDEQLNRASEDAEALLNTINTSCSARCADIHATADSYAAALAALSHSKMQQLLRVLGLSVNEAGVLPGGAGADPVTPARIARPAPHLDMLTDVLLKALGSSCIDDPQRMRSLAFGATSTTTSSALAAPPDDSENNSSSSSSSSTSSSDPSSSSATATVTATSVDMADITTGTDPAAIVNHSTSVDDGAVKYAHDSVNEATQGIDACLVAAFIFDHDPFVRRLEAEKARVLAKQKRKEEEDAALAAATAAAAAAAAPVRGGSSTGKKPVSRPPTASATAAGKAKQTAPAALSTLRSSASDGTPAPIASEVTETTTTATSIESPAIDSVSSTLGLAALRFSTPALATLIEKLRIQCVKQLVGASASIQSAAANLCETKKALAQAQLSNDLLRLAPRSIQIAATIVEPRLRELISHSQRWARYREAAEIKLAATVAAFNAQLESLSSIGSAAVADIQSLHHSTVGIIGITTAAVTGTVGTTSDITTGPKLVAARLKLSGAKTSTASSAAAIERHLTDAAAVLTSSGTAYLNACIPLSDAHGSYSTDEIMATTSAVHEFNERVRTDLERCRALVRSAVVKVEETLDAATESHAAAHRILREDAELEEAKGLRYSKPRRKYYQGIREIVMKSEAEAAEVDSRLDELAALIRTNHAGSSAATAAVVADATGCAASSVPCEQSEALVIASLAYGLHDEAPPAATPAAEEEEKSAAGARLKPKTAGAAKPTANRSGSGAAAATPSSGKAETGTASTAAAVVTADLMTPSPSAVAAAGPVNPSAPTWTSPPLSIRIRRSVIVLRDKLVRNAVHLGALRPLTPMTEVDSQRAPPQQQPRFSLPFISLADGPSVVSSGTDGATTGHRHSIAMNADSAIRAKLEVPDARTDGDTAGGGVGMTILSGSLQFPAVDTSDALYSILEEVPKRSAVVPEVEAAGTAPAGASKKPPTASAPKKASAPGSAKQYQQAAADAAQAAQEAAVAAVLANVRGISTLKGPSPGALSRELFPTPAPPVPAEPEQTSKGTTASGKKPTSGAAVTKGKLAASAAQTTHSRDSRSSSSTATASVDTDDANNAAPDATSCFLPSCVAKLTQFETEIMQQRAAAAAASESQPTATTPPLAGAATVKAANTASKGAAAARSVPTTAAPSSATTSSTITTTTTTSVTTTRPSSNAVKKTDELPSSSVVEPAETSSNLSALSLHERECFQGMQSALQTRLRAQVSRLQSMLAASSEALVADVSLRNAATVRAAAQALTATASSAAQADAVELKALEDRFPATVVLSDDASRLLAEAAAELQTKTAAMVNAHAGLRALVENRFANELAALLEYGAYRMMYNTALFSMAAEECLAPGDLLDVSTAAAAPLTTSSIAVYGLSESSIAKTLELSCSSSVISSSSSNAASLSLQPSAALLQRRTCAQIARDGVNGAMGLQLQTATTSSFKMIPGLTVSLARPTKELDAAAGPEDNPSETGAMRVPDTAWSNSLVTVRNSAHSSLISLVQQSLVDARAAVLTAHQGTEELQRKLSSRLDCLSSVL